MKKEIRELTHKKRLGKISRIKMLNMNKSNTTTILHEL